MAQAIVDPAELRRFAQQLRRFNQDVSKQLTMLQGQFVKLADTWRDQEQKKFTERFEMEIIALSRLIEQTSEYIPFLMRKADRVEEYIQQR